MSCIYILENWSIKKKKYILLMIGAFHLYEKQYNTIQYIINVYLLNEVQLIFEQN